ncbi:hypothetical protein PV327_006496 [Microctonus hyperodae]|uniref:Amine oxidase domain-containing protein n=1 Tax=Microctonus hyperodae TaxID=165561 RepID=A0AA39KID8_MICHY|nr:hypothetical protein PV327_006496 [Microctonus hyperodae]
MNILLALLCCNTCELLNNELADNSSPKVVIVGAGPAGIAAATRLLENGFTDITILEAENRIGGRIHSVKLDNDYMVDMGGQWVHGEKNNAVFELAWPLGLLEKFDGNYKIQLDYFESSGMKLPQNLVHDIQRLEARVNDNIIRNTHEEFKSFAEYAQLEYFKYFEEHSEVRYLLKSLLYSFQLSEMVTDGGKNTWHDISAKGIRNYADCEGDSNINWKNRTYSTILDILMKKYPNPEDELPVLEKTYKNTKVTKINYNKIYDTVKISTANGKEYSADHVIFTPSLGVLKANYQRLFNPPLPEKKVTAIENIGYGIVAKIYLYYDNPWWTINGNKYFINSIYWTEEDEEEINKDPDRNWMLGVYGIVPVEHKPKLLCLWMSSARAIEMELIPRDIFNDQIIELLDRFFGNYYNITEPTKIIRSSWNINDNFHGAYSYPSIAAETMDVNYVDLSEPIMRNEKPILQFSGEATSEHFATVHGAIESGWREADRLINLYSRKNELSQFLKRISQES